MYLGTKIIQIVIHYTRNMTMFYMTYSCKQQCGTGQSYDVLLLGVAPILVATDVASRGIDIKDIT